MYHGNGGSRSSEEYDLPDIERWDYCLWSEPLQGFQVASTARGWGKRELLVSPELLYEPRRRRQCTKPPKAATHTLLLWEPIRTVLCPWQNQMDREAVLVELRRERNRQRKNNKSRKQHVWGWMEIQYICLRVNLNTTGDSWPSTLALIDLSVSIQYIKNLLCR